MNYGSFFTLLNKACETVLRRKIKYHEMNIPGSSLEMLLYNLFNFQAHDSFFYTITKNDDIIFSDDNKHHHGKIG